MIAKLFGGGVRLLTTSLLASLIGWYISVHVPLNYHLTILDLMWWIPIMIPTMLCVRLVDMFMYEK